MNRQILELERAIFQSFQKEKGWAKFLAHASWHYKQSFENQLLIVAQRTDATAVTTMQAWNKKLNRYVNTGAKRILGIEKQGGVHSFINLFDIKDTHLRDPDGLDFQPWQHNPTEDDALLERLKAGNAQFNTIKTLPDYLFERIEGIMNEPQEDDKIRALQATSSLSEWDIEDMITLIKDSCFHQVMARLGKPDERDFQAITRIQRFKELQYLGQRINAINKPLLIEIGKNIEVIQNEKEKQNDRNKEGRTNDPRGNQSAHHLSQEGKILQPEYRAIDTTKSANREVRADAFGVLGKIRPSTPNGPDFREQNQRTPGGYRQTNGSEARDHNETVDGQQSATIESGISIRMGMPHDAVGATSRGTDLAGTGLHQRDLDTQLKTQSPQEAEDAKQTSSASLRVMEDAHLSEQLTASALKIEEVDNVLRMASNRTNGEQRIFLKYLHDMPSADITEFLKLEYRTGGRGLRIGTKEIAAWWDKDGLLIGLGKTALQANDRIFLSWEQVESRIRKLIQSGTYISTERVEHAVDNEYIRLANQLIFAYQDDMRDICKMPTEWEENGRGFPSITEKVASLLSESESLNKIIATLQTDNIELKTRDDERYWRRTDVDKLITDLQEWQRTMVLLKNETLPDTGVAFITEDEIDALLCGGSSFSDTKARIIRHFLNEHTRKESADFLKKEFGTGGRSPAFPYVDDSFENHGSKGLSLIRGRGIGHAKVEMSWNSVAKRIDTLIHDGRFFTQAELNDFRGRYTKHVVASEIASFYYNIPNDLMPEGTESPFAQIEHSPKQIEIVEAKLDDPAQVESICATMERVLPQLDENIRNIDGKTAYLKTLQAYRDGTLDLIPQRLTVPVPDAIMSTLATGNKKKMRQIKLPMEMAGEKTADISQLSLLEMLEDLKGAPTATPQVVTSGQTSQDVQSQLTKREHLVTHKDNQPETSVRAEQASFDSFSGKEEKISNETKSVEVAAIETVVNETKDVEVAAIETKDVEAVVIETEGVEAVVNETKDVETAVIETKDVEAVVIETKDVEAAVIETETSETQDHQEEPEEMNLTVGERCTIDGNVFEVEDINESTGRVRLMDITMREVYRYPVSRNESIGFVLERKREAEEAPPPIPIEERAFVNYRLSNEPVTQSTREKFEHNLTAIQTLKQLEAENRMATPDEQALLADYVGWGGLAQQAFDSENTRWQPLQETLKTLLTDQEYQKARESTLNAHYTPDIITRGMYTALSNMGFRNGNILEPAMGTGRFFGHLPTEMDQAKLYGVEIDPLTARIAKQLYPNANIFEGGFEKTNYPNNFFEVGIGNVPFGDYQVYDKEYNKENFRVHDYFLAKTLDKLRPGGVMAMVTSQGTMDKKNPAVRDYLAKRAELLGAVRLPNTAFHQAGTEVTSDILFFKKRESMALGEEEWVQLGQDENGIAMNAYFVAHPEMILGEMQMISGPFGEKSACIARDGIDLETALQHALQNITYVFPETALHTMPDDGNEKEALTIPADPKIDNFSYAVVDDQIYFRTDSVMVEKQLPPKAAERIKGMVTIRDCVKDVFEVQLSPTFKDEDLKAAQEKLNVSYDHFVKAHGRINTIANKRAFSEDNRYWLICGLEILNKEEEFERKSDIFTQRTIQPPKVVTSVETASEALVLSMCERGHIDFDYMEKLCGKTPDQIKSDLQGIIFRDPEKEAWVTGDEYLSGNVRIKLKQAQKALETEPQYQINVTALEKAQPKPLEASEIVVNLGATWIEDHVINQFIEETFKPPSGYIRRGIIGVEFLDTTGVWHINGKKTDSYSNVLTKSTYGTSRVNAYEILENALNLKSMRITDMVMTDAGERRVVNQEQTMLANQKGELIKEEFKRWIFDDPERRNRLVEKYNRLFNTTQERKYNGEHIVLHGVSTEIKFRDYQCNAVARGLYGDNLLLNHCVGAGKTFVMAAIGMEGKHLGLWNKSMFVAPNHLVGQWGTEFLKLYPGANLLVSTEKDFEQANRQKFCSRIATGNYDGIIIGHSQFERIPLSNERQAYMLTRQIDEVVEGLEKAKKMGGAQFTVKQLEKTRKSLEARLQKLNESKKDQVITFEQLGVDKLFIDEAHSYKNLFLYTKMQNVSGIGQSDSLKATDMFNKCQYMDELTGGKGIVFATGTPVSNALSELYVMMRYLMFTRLKEMNFELFDSWAACFAEQVTAVELAPEGGTYRSKTRLARFNNIPELMTMYREVADIITKDMINLKIPEASYETIVSKATPNQKELLQEITKRADEVRNRRVTPEEDNLLKITNDGRKLALDPRLCDASFPAEPENKTSLCAANAFEIWKETKEQKTTQLIFCDIGTPNKKREYNIYDDIKKKLIEKGVPKEEIAFIHDAKTKRERMAIFKKMRMGQLRFLFGSTQKMGAGTNIQDRLIALHHPDVPWRPSDIEQRDGRGLRHGNMNPVVRILRYVTEGTFDAYSWQTIEIKQRMVSQIMTGDTTIRSMEAIDAQALSFAEIKSLATGNPLIREKMDLDIELAKLKLLQSEYVRNRYANQDSIVKLFPRQIRQKQEQIENLKKDIKSIQEKWNPEAFKMTIMGKTYEDKKEAGKALVGPLAKMLTDDKMEIGEYAGLQLEISVHRFNGNQLSMKNHATHTVQLGIDPLGNITRINNIMKAIPERIEACERELADIRERLANAKIEVQKPFEKDEDLKAGLVRMTELIALLSADTPKAQEDAKVQEDANESDWTEAI